ncbi:hypothetical protein TRFO_03312 [Tritrichomonas foetus]|uniref:Trafficking protein particle complex subunit n=1 Tax=Tritrichomonas foetus TaxID=1144522 RepID=A0A1J4KQI0_9EUKA|nr:hypothetical protein TRFO_03312 [Tritrichomonas foetus]|eukprot:OHT13561.1 hypothetical protein TRFO_03312 [Tritrichomonas foetus]
MTRLPDKQTRIPKTTYALLFGEVIQYCHQNADSMDSFGKQLHSMGYPVGCAILEVLTQNKETSFKTQQKEVPMLLLVKEKIWPFLFGAQATELQQQLDDQSCYMMYDDKPMVTQFISLPADIRNQFTCCAFVAGIIEGILTSAGHQCRVSGHPNPMLPSSDKVVYLIKFLNESSS